jgi:hypothetical protein
VNSGSAVTEDSGITDTATTSTNALAAKTRYFNLVQKSITAAIISSFP